MGGRADLPCSDRPLHLLVGQGPAAVGPSYLRCRPGPAAGGAVRGQLLGLRPAQADQGRPSGRHRRRTGPGRPPHGPGGHPGASRARKRFTTRSDPTATRAPDLLKRDFTANRPDRTWVAVTYCSTWSGIVYVSFVVDVLSRRIVGWKASRTMATSLFLDALKHGRLGPTWGSMGWCVTAMPAASTPPSGCSRSSCTATLPRWPPTADRGGASTTSSWPPAGGSAGSTSSVCTASWATELRRGRSGVATRPDRQHGGMTPNRTCVRRIAAHRGPRSTTVASSTRGSLGPAPR